MEVTLIPSSWCRARYDEAIDEGRMEDADNYRRLFELWLGRNL